MVLTSWLFGRWMALMYLVAFWSLAVQVLGLVGSHGILPVADFLNSSNQGNIFHNWQLLPTLCWFNSSNGFLLFLCWGGVALSLLLLVGFMPGFMAFLLWLFYLSLTSVGQDFLAFQWDNLLLEAGVLLIFLTPRPGRVSLKPSVDPSRIIIWLLRWLLFRLMFQSGLVKLISGDPHWANLTALTFHYWTQPLPNLISWYMAQLPLWFQKFSCFLVFAVELVFPFFIFFGRRARLVAFGGIVTLQTLILLTGNYCFFNLLAIGLCLTLLDDDLLRRFCPQPPVEVQRGGLVYRVVTVVVAVIVVVVSTGEMLWMVRVSVPRPVAHAISLMNSWRSINSYGLFAVMTTRRNEIILEGSNDGQHWRPYEFSWKPGDVRQPPSQVAPYQPRLDWQMWFAALGSWRENPWVLSLMAKLLHGDPAVEHLLGTNPFPDKPPTYMRATLWSYHFTDFKTRRQTGHWWARESKGLYCPVVSLR